ncbi:DUF4442 domain-containing protein [Pleomorphovibrio marinus]|uniref:DUF4442 domain-containing protein n=1 Tax=Pleomorphovibrio marinus TaxID=2164132 RepID=UPI000E0B4419|nr:DUF4442 domain-containing protein [Pleomorphovibrio marinus]
MNENKPIPLSPKQVAFQQAMCSPLKFRWFLLWKLPSVLFWGIRIAKLDEKQCVVSLPFTYRTKNPFKSIYFAALAGAAELASGALCLLHLQGEQRFSSLVTGVEGEFFKKANQPILFTCLKGDTIKEVTSSLSSPGFTASITLPVEGTNPNGEVVARFNIHWSFKVKE